MLDSGQSSINRKRIERRFDRYQNQILSRQRNRVMRVQSVLLNFEDFLNDDFKIDTTVTQQPSNQME